MVRRRRLPVDFIPEVAVTCDVGGEVTLPDTVEVVYNDRAANTQEDVTWDAEQLAAIDTGQSGKLRGGGTLADGTAMTAQVEVEMVNYVLNPSFEDKDTSMWKVSYEGENNPTDFQNKADDAYTGDIAFHFWSGDSDMNFSIEHGNLRILAAWNLSAFGVRTGRRICQRTLRWNCMQWQTVRNGQIRL